MKTRLTSDSVNIIHHTPILRREFKEGNLNRTISAHIITQTNNSINNRISNVILSKVVTLFGKKKKSLLIFKARLKFEKELRWWDPNPNIFKSRFKILHSITQNLLRESCVCSSATLVKSSTDCRALRLEGNRG